LFQAPRGTADILPDDQPYWQYVATAAQTLSELYGYRRIDTPIFESTSLFIRGVGEVTDIVEKEMYSFRDRGGDELTLRPEATAAIARAYLQHGMRNLPQPVKLYTIGPFFRYDRPQAGRYRQFHQFNYEALGEADPALDVEIIEMAWRFYERLGLRDLTIQVNSIGDPTCRPHYVEHLRRYYADHIDDICPDCRLRLGRSPLRLLDCKNPSCQPIIEAAPRSIDFLCRQCADHFSRLMTYLGRLELPVKLNHRLVRGLDYYTRTVFEVWPPEVGAQASLGGGGRYDGLIEELDGPPTPGIGFATGIERIVLSLKRQGIAVPMTPPPSVYVAYLGEEPRLRTVTLLAEIRRAGIPAVGSYGERSLKAQLRHADSLNVPLALILGEAELSAGTIILRNMARAEQREIPLDKVVEAIRSELSACC